MAALCKIVAILFFLSAWPGVTFAYVDPGTGSILIQGLIASIAAVGVTLKIYWHRIVDFFKREEPQQESAQGETEDGSTS